MIATILSPSTLRLQKHTDLSAHDFDALSRLPRLFDFTYASSWRLYGTNPITVYSCRALLSNRAVASLVTKFTELFWLFLRRQLPQRLNGGGISRDENIELSFGIRTPAIQERTTAPSYSAQQDARASSHVG